jgi:hypothetical protein
LEGLDTLGGDTPEEVNVVVAVEGGHLLRTRGMLPVALHLAEQAIVEDEVVGELDAKGLHGVPTAIVMVPYVCEGGDGGVEARCVVGGPQEGKKSFL